MNRSLPRLLTSTALIILPLLTLGGCVTPSRFENEYGRLVPEPAPGVAVPTGMRRTVNGWEDASQWYIPAEIQSRSLEDWMSRQRDREPAWARQMIRRIRATPPLMIAVIQIAAIATIFRVSRQQKSRDPE